jgi:hypothetical protein
MGNLGSRQHADTVLRAVLRGALLIHSLIILICLPTTALGEDQPAETTIETLPDMHSLASLVSDKLMKVGIKTIAVNHFYLEKSSSGDTLGNKISDEFAASLVKISPNLQIVERATLTTALQDKKWLSIDIYDRSVYNSIAKLVGVEAVIDGKFKISGDVFDLSITVVKTSDRKTLTEVKTKFPVTAPLKNLLNESAPIRDSATGAYIAGPGGVTGPTCKFCPKPEFSPEALRQKITRAQSVLRVTVGVDGRVSQIRPVQLVGFGLDENSVAAVESWQLIPGHLPDGTPVPTRVNVEVNFNL